MFYFKYALKSLIQRRRQYISLFSVCTISVCIIISLLSICDGMLNALNTKAVQYYGGELQLVGGNPWYITNPEEKSNIISESLNEMGFSNFSVNRFDFEGKDTEFYFEGQNVYCRILKGIDFSNEKHLLSTLTFCEGSWEIIDRNSILLSEPVAGKLGCHIGDNITIYLKQNNGLINTRDLYVAGIFKDSSLFGMYTAYIDINSLYEITGVEKGYINRIGILLEKEHFSEKKIKLFQYELSQKINMAPIPARKEVFLDYEAWGYSEPVFALITLEANRPEVVMMSNALRLIVYLIIIPLVLIVAIGIACSYRVVILKRILETSTFRALGLKARGVEKLFFTEVLMILLVGFIVGTGLSFAVTAILGHFNFSFIPAFDLFLIGGRIKADYSLWKTIFVLFIIAISTLAGVFVTLRNIIHLSPAKAFATTV
ncbi:MAG: FtsX-like permease family protein [Treponema sp.]|nr:FtsX-like permease family protein [Treponema sp.]